MIILCRGPLLLCYKLFFYLLLGLPTFSGASTGGIIARVGTDVTLTCSYDAQYYGKLSACWGRGAIPNSGCANEVIKSDGTSVTSRLSERYLLMGNLAAGDVSLTIRQVQESDSGMYGCRVEIPGWFNDHKHQTTLTVVAGRPDAIKMKPREVKERTITVQWTPAFDGGRPITSYRIRIKDKQASWDTAMNNEISNPKLTQLTLVDLRPAKTYNLCMFATNSEGTSDISNVLSITTKEAAPEGPPLDMQLEGLTSHSIKVTWKPPRPDLRNGVLRSYSISYRESGATDKQPQGWQRLTVPATREIESVILSNLKPSTKYGVLIQASTKAGVGPAATAPFCSTLDEVYKTSTASVSLSTSIAATLRTEHTTHFTPVHTASTAEPVSAATVGEDNATTIASVPPEPPVVELKEVIGNTISLSWTPGFEGDSPITGYLLEYKAVNASWDYTKTVVDFGLDQREATIIEMNPSTYNIRMLATSNVGTSRPSNVLTITTGGTGHQADEVMTTMSTDAQANPSVKHSQNGRLTAIIVPVVLLVLVVTLLATWQLRRIKQKNGSLSMWLAGGALRYSGSESLQEL